MNENFYDENSVKDDDLGVLVEIDLNKKQTLHELIKTVRSKLDNSANITLFIVCDKTINKIDYSPFIEYLKLNFNQNVYIRGYFHFELLNLLVNHNCSLSIDTKVIYTAKKLNQIQKSIKGNSSLFNKFIQRYSELYFQYSKVELPLTELTLLGLKYETF